MFGNVHPAAPKIALACLALMLAGCGAEPVRVAAPAEPTFYNKLNAARTG